MGYTRTMSGVFLAVLSLGVVDACKSSPPTTPVQEVSAKSVEDIFECDVKDAGEDFKQLAAANTEFFISLYQSIKEEGNVLVSPYSIFSGLSLLQLGTGGVTRTQYQEVLQYGEGNGTKIHQESRAVLDSLARLSRVSNESFILSSANNIFIDSGFAVLPSYQARSQCYYQAGVQELPLQSQPQESADMINTWVSNKTRGRITDLVSAGSLGENTQAVLVNTVYFKAPWLLPFSKWSTQAGVGFSRQDGSEVQVDMMALEKHLAYAQLPGGVVVELDYDTCRNCDEKSAEMAMYVFVPDTEVDWEVFEQEVLKTNILNGEGIEFDHEAIRLEMPKFEISHQVDLVPALTELGLNLGGDFTELSNSPVAVSDVLHQAFLRVDEEGSEGAAATALFMSRMLFIPRLRVTANRTFFLSIVHKQSRVLVFAGKVNRPDTVTAY